MSAAEKPTEGLADALAAHGLTLPANAEPGRLVRMPGAGKGPSNRAGWLKLFPDGQGAVFGDWSTGLQETWQARKPANDDELQRWRQIAEQAQAEADHKRHQSATEAAQAARQEWDAATAPDALHGYLISKGIDPHGIKQSGDLLLVPVYVNGELSSLQRIATDGSKRFMPGGRIKGGYHLIGDPAERIVIAEGYATASSIHETTGEAVAVAFNCGNLQAVAEAMRTKYPDARITVAADDDRNMEGNPGLTKATEAAQAVNGLIATPGQPGDFNDLHQAEGADALAERMAQAKPVQFRGFRLIKAGTIKPRPLDWRIAGMFEDDSILLIVGDPSAGKSFLALDMAACIASGTAFHGRKAKQGPVVYIAGEGRNGIARRRAAWEIRNEIDLADAPLYMSSGAANIGDPESTGEVLRAIEATGQTPALVVLDTLNRNMAGDENSTPDMRQFIQCCDEIRTAYNCTVALVHHTGHGDKSRARGSSVLHGAIDTTYHVTKDAAGIVTVECTRMKDGPIPDPFAFTFQTVELGFKNEDGSEATSAVLHPTGVPEASPKVSGKWQTTAYGELKRLQAKHVERLRSAGQDTGAAKVRRDDWRDSCIDRLKVPPNRFAEAERALKEKGLVTQEGYYITAF